MSDKGGVERVEGRRGEWRSEGRHRWMKGGREGTLVVLFIPNIIQVSFPTTILRRKRRKDKEEEEEEERRREVYDDKCCCSYY